VLKVGEGAISEQGPRLVFRELIKSTQTAPTLTKGRQGSAIAVVEHGPQRRRELRLAHWTVGPSPHPKGQGPAPMQTRRLFGGASGVFRAGEFDDQAPGDSPACRFAVGLQSGSHYSTIGAGHTRETLFSVNLTFADGMLSPPRSAYRDFGQAQVLSALFSAPSY